MRPTVEEIRRAAYDRWERRGWDHGGDRYDWYAAETELTFHANYRTIVEYALEGSGPRILADGSIRRCRFCEQTAAPAKFGGPRPVVLGRSVLLTAEICDDCQEDWRDGLDERLLDFWARLPHETPWVDNGRPAFTVAAFATPTPDMLTQTLVAVALYAMYEVGLLLARAVTPPGSPRPRTGEMVGGEGLTRRGRRLCRHRPSSFLASRVRPTGPRAAL